MPKNAKSNHESDVKVESFAIGQYGYSQRVHTDMALNEIYAAKVYLECSLLPCIKHFKEMLEQIEISIKLSKPCIAKLNKGG